MEITSFGYFFLPVCFFCFLLPVRYLFAITVFSCIFSTTYVFAYTLEGSRALFTWLLAPLFFIVKNFSIDPLWTDLRKDGFIQRVLLFILFAVAASLIFPHLDWNIQAGFDLEETRPRTIAFQGAHIRQIGYLFLFFLSIYSIYRNREKLSSDFVEKSFIASVIAVCLIGLWEFTSKTTGTHTFPYSFLYNNPSGFYSEPGYMQGFGKGLMRLNSTFSEPSYCGAFLAASFWGIMSMDKFKYKWLCILIGLTMIFNLSGTGIVSFFAGVPIFLYLKNKGKYILWMIIAGAILAIIAHQMDYSEYIINMVMNKKHSASGFERGATVYYSWEVFLKTWGVGVGLGGLRGGSFLVSMLASLGVVGTFLFGRIYYYIFKHLEEHNKWLTVFALVLLVAQTIAVPDFTYSPMWMFFFMATALLPSKAPVTNLSPATPVTYHPCNVSPAAVR